MKKTIKALALTIALLTTTACGNKTAVNEEVKVAAVETQTTKEAAIANIEAPKALAEETKENKSLVIPQTVALVEEKEEEIELATEETEIVANTEKVAANTVEVKAETKEEEVATIGAEIAHIDSVSRTSESTSLPNTVEENVAAPVAEAVEATAEEVVETVEGGLTKQSPSAEAVKAYWNNYQSKAANTANFHGIQLVNQEDIFAQAPNADLNALNLGALTQAAQEDALHIANTIRYATGLNEMTLGANQATYAQAATMVNRLNLAVSHYPAQPAGLDANTYLVGAHGAENSNLASSFGLLDSVLEYVKDDLGQENQLEVGHRRWILNPSATQVGFGQTEEFNAMYVNNNNYAGQNANEVVAYPSTTAISEFHSSATSLSLMFGENFNIQNASVEVTDLATGEVNTAMHIDGSFKGNGQAITFGYGMNYAPGSKLAVKVTGVTKNGVAYPVEYTINYMSIRG